MTEITDFNFAEDDFTAADLAKFELIKLEGEEDLNNLAELLNQAVAAKVAKLSQEKEEYYTKQLASKELELNTFYNHSPSGYFSTDGNGIINKINDTLLAWLGYSKKEIIGKVTWQSLLSVGGKMYFETHYSPLLQMQGFVQEISFEMVKKDKTRLPILINTKQIRDENGKLKINYSTVFDVSQRKSYEKELLIAKRAAEEQTKLIHETNEKLLASEEELKSKVEEVKSLNENLNKLVEYTFKNASIPIYFVLEDASIYDFNNTAAENLGYTSEELHSLKMYDLDTHYDEKKWSSVWAKLKEKKKITIETQQKKKDGTLTDVIITANYVKYGDLELKCSFVLDITEKKKQEEQLKLFDFTLRNSSLATYYINKDGSFYDYNDAGCKQLGYTKEEFKALNVFNTAIGQDENSYRSLWGEMKEKGQINFDAQQIRKDGTLIDVNIICSYVKFGEKELNCTYVVDITEKKKQEQQLQLLDYSYRHTDSAMSFLDANGLFIDFNQATANMLGYKIEEFRGKTIMDINPKVTKDFWVKRLEELKVTPNQKFEAKFKKKDGTLIDVAVSTNSIELNGKIVNFGFYKDITETKKQEQQLQLLDYSYKHTDSAMFFLDVNGLYIDFNQATANMLGYTYEEFRGKTLMDVNPTVTKEYWAQRWEELKEIPNQNFQVKLKKKDGTLIDVEINTNSLELNGAVVNFGFYKDITEKKKLEDNLKLSAFIIDNAAWGLAYVKADGTLYNCNIAFAKLYGNTSLEEMKTKTAFDFGSAYTTETWKKYWDELKQKKSIHYTVKRTKKDGTSIDLEINANMIQFGDLELNCIYVNDVTEKIKAEYDLKQSNQRYEYATLATSEVIWEADLLKNEIIISKNFTTFYGHPVDDGWMPMENDIWRQNINPDDFEILMEERSAVLNSKESNNRWIGEYRLRKADGSYATVIDKTFAIKDEDGRIIRMVGALQDITKQRVEEERLRLMESIILNSNDSILVTEAEPYDLPGPRILFVNKAFTEMTGYSAEEVIGKTPRILQNEDTDRKELDRLYTSLKKWESCEVTVSNSRKNGEKFWLNMQITPIANDKGWFTHWIAVERDVTKQKEAEEEKETLLKELVENNLELKQFSYITSHNMRAPLTNLVSICNIIQPPVGTDELTLQLIDAFKTSTYSLNETLNDLIEVLIIKENRNITKEQLTFEEIFKKTKESISISLVENKVTINEDFSESPVVNFANEYLESVFLNLLTNAVKYRHPDRDLIITIKTNKETNGTTKLTFSDNGIGINMHHAKDKIFGLYKRFHNNADSKGIGLYLIHSQITTLGGKIEVESEVNIGTTFTITFK